MQQALEARLKFAAPRVVLAEVTPSLLSASGTRRHDRDGRGNVVVTRDAATDNATVSTPKGGGNGLPIAHTPRVMSDSTVLKTVEVEQTARSVIPSCIAARCRENPQRFEPVVACKQTTGLAVKPAARELEWSITDEPRVGS